MILQKILQLLEEAKKKTTEKMMKSLLKQNVAGLRIDIDLSTESPDNQILSGKTKSKHVLERQRDKKDVEFSRAGTPVPSSQKNGTYWWKLQRSCRFQVPVTLYIMSGKQSGDIRNENRIINDIYKTEGRSIQMKDNWRRIIRVSKGEGNQNQDMFLIKAFFSECE